MRMGHDESDYPDEGTITVSWRVKKVEGRGRLSWVFVSEPRLDPALAVALLRGVARDLEGDQPAV